MRKWREFRNIASQKFRLTPGPKEKRRILPESTPVLRVRSLLWLFPGVPVSHPKSPG